MIHRDVRIIVPATAVLDGISRSGDSDDVSLLSSSVAVQLIVKGTNAIIYLAGSEMSNDNLSIPIMALSPKNNWTEEIKVSGRSSYRYLDILLMVGDGSPA